MARVGLRDHHRQSQFASVRWIFVGLELVGLGCGSEVVRPPLQSSLGEGGSGGSSTDTAGSTNAAGGGGVVEGPGAVLDPSHVYIVGEIQAGVCNSAALVNWQTPDLASVGFDCACEYWDATIRPTDGRLLMRCADGEAFARVLHEFHCDGCPYMPDEYPSFPENPLSNDTLLPSPCQDLAWFDVAPDGSVLHVCTGDHYRWLDDNGSVLHDELPGDALIRVGYDGRALTQRRIVELGSSGAVDIAHLPVGDMVAARAVQPDGYRIAIYLGQDAYTQPDYHELWHVDGAGVATLVGSYPPLPAGYGADPRFGQLDSAGAFLQHALKDGVGSVVRREVGATSQVVYAGEVGPLVSVDSHGYLVTGP